MFMAFFTKYFPKSDNQIRAGVGLAVLNAVFLAIGGGIVYALLKLASYIRSIGVLIPLPVWLILFFIGIPYFTFSFEYGKAYSKNVKDDYIWRGLVVAIIGNIPSFILLYIMKSAGGPIAASAEMYNIINNILEMLVTVLPIMTFLGTMDRKS